jgi:hypothetical protein
MNIFVLDTDVVKCAQYHVDKYCVKMILETTQLLNNAAIVNHSDYQPVYKQTHKNHPCSLWAGKSQENFDWLISLGLALCNEYTYRYNKTHKCEAFIKAFKYGNSRLSFPKIGLTPFALCMPDEHKISDAVESYRNYYRKDKAYIAKWTGRDIPNWWKNEI